MHFKEETILVNNKFEISYSINEIREDYHFIVFIHGFGSSKRFFRYAYTHSLLKKFNLVAIDLLGFGSSTKIVDFSYTMDIHAEFIVKFLEKLNIEKFHLVGHSMGSLVAMKVIKLVKQKVLSFINLEGNLTLEDCTMTGKIIEMEEAEFLGKGREEIEKTLASLDDPSIQSYLMEFKKASSIALYRSAFDAVEESKNPELIESFIELPVKRCYIYGDKNKGKFSAEKKLLAVNVPIYYIKNSGHSMAVENPEQLYNEINTFISNIETDDD